MCRPRSAPTRPRGKHGIGSSVSTSTTGCGVRGGLGGPMRPARAPGRAAGSSRQQGRALGVRVLTVVAARRRRGSAAWRPPRTHPPGTGHPGVVTGSGLGLTPPSHASPGNGVPRGRHRVGTEHTRWWRLPGVHARAVMAVAPPHASSENRAARSRHGVGTEHTGRAEAGLHVAHGSAGGEQAVGRAMRQGGHGDGGACCGVLGRCGQRGRHSCGMPLILERRGHPGTFLGVGCPFGT